MDGRVINIVIHFSLKASQDFNKFEVLENAWRDLIEYIQDYSFEIGEPLYVTNFYNILKQAIGVDDVLKVQITQASGAEYSDTSYRIKNHMSADGRMIYVPEDSVLEIKYYDVDIVGAVK